MLFLDTLFKISILNSLVKQQAMKKPYLYLLFFITMYSSAQVKYEKAYYITNSGETINGFLKNEDWSNNPSQIEFKTNLEDSSKHLSAKNIAEFGIHNKYKYIGANVEIDRATDNTNYLTTTRNPEFQKEFLFFKTLIEGDANLYIYRDNNLVRFFYKKDDVPLQQLVYKRYRASTLNVGKNEQYKQQLLNTLKCKSIDISLINKLEYDQSGLVRLFKNYNKCKDNLMADYDENKSKGNFNLTLRPSIRSNSFSLKNSVDQKLNTEFDNEFSFGMGVEVEYVMPFNKNKWALIFEPTYQSYNSSPTTNEEGDVVKLEYSSVELPLGLRHYLFLNEKSKFFVNASYVLDLAMDSKVVFESDPALDVTSSSSLALGIGFKYNNKYSLEVRYQTERTLLQSYLAYTSKFGVVSLLVGYTIF